MLRVICVLALCLALSASWAAAADEPVNAWGMYLAPTTSGFASGTDYDLGTSSTNLEWGLYYTRFIGERFSLRLEARYARRHLDAAAPDSTFGYIPFRQEEDILEFPLLAQSERRILYGTREVRVTLGAGVVYDVVLDQRLLTPLGQPNVLTPSDYQKFGWLLDGAVTFEVDQRGGVFGRFRYQRDEVTFGQDDGASAIRKLESYGFSVGFEFMF